MQGCREHRDFCWGDVILSADANGNEYLMYTERQTKTRSGVDNSNFRKVLPKIFSSGTERDPIAVYKIYRDERPTNVMADDAPFYLGTNYTRKDSSTKSGSRRHQWCKQIKHLNKDDGFESKHQQ